MTNITDEKGSQALKMKESPTALVVPKWDYTIEAIWPVLEELKLRHYAIHMVLYDFDEKLVDRLRGAGMNLHLFNENEIRRAAPRWMRLLRLNEWWARVLARRKMDGLFKQVAPAVVYSTGETRLLARPLIRRANRENVPTIDVGWSFSNPQSDYDQQRTDLVQRFGTKVVDQAFIFHFEPKMGRQRRSRGWFDRLTRHIAARPDFARVLRRVIGWVWWPFYRATNTDYRETGTGMGRGEARCMTCLGPAFVKQFVDQGVSRDKLVVTGLPELDCLHRLTEKDKRECLDKLAARYSLDASKPLVFWAPRASAEDGYQEDQVRDQERAVAEALLARPEGLQIICKLHPRTKLERFRSWLPENPRLVLTLEADKVELIAACDAFVSTYSSVVLWALALDKLVFTYNVLRIPGGDIFAEWVGGVVHARTLPEITRSIDVLFGDEATRKRLVAERARARETHAVFDGKSAARIVDLAQSLP